MKIVLNLVVFLSLMFTSVAYGANAEEIKAVESEEEKISSMRLEIANQIIDLELFLRTVLSLLLRKDTQKSAGLDIATNACLTKGSIADAKLKISIFNRILEENGDRIRNDCVRVHKTDPTVAARNSLSLVLKIENEITAIVRDMNFVRPTSGEIFEKIIMLCSMENKLFSHSIIELHTFILMRLHKIFSDYLAIVTPAESETIVVNFRRMLKNYSSNTEAAEMYHYLTQFTSHRHARDKIAAVNITLNADILDLIVMYIGCLDELAPLEEDLSLNDKCKRIKLKQSADNERHPIIAFLEGDPSPKNKAVSTIGRGAIMNIFRSRKK